MLTVIEHDQIVQINCDKCMHVCMFRQRLDARIRELREEGFLLIVSDMRCLKLDSISSLEAIASEEFCSQMNLNLG